MRTAQRRRTVAALRALHDVAGAAGAAPYAADALRDVLHLRTCRYEAGPAGAGGVPILDEQGALSSRVPRRTRDGSLVLPEVVHLAAGAGRFVLVPEPGSATTLEERLVAVAIAALAAAHRGTVSGGVVS